MKKRIGIDIDGTVTCPTTLVPYLNEAFDVNLTYEDITAYDLTKVVEVTPEDFAQWFRQVEPTIYEQSPLAKGAKEVLLEWKEQFELFFISARGTHLLDLTRQWFDRNDLYYHHIELIGTHNKIESVKKHNIELFLEDKHDNAVSIHEECGIPVLLFDAPYNQDPIPEGVIRVKGWQQAKQWVNDWLKQR
jgi:uncharacterized protein